MGAGRRHETPGLETKDFITPGTAGSELSMFVSGSLASGSHVGDLIWVRWKLQVEVRNTESGESMTFLGSSK